MVNLSWLRRHDAGLSATRRAGRAAIVMPAMFAIGTKVIDNATLATFAAFGSFALLLLVDFGGTLRERLTAQAALAVVGSALVCLGTLASQSVWVAALAMAAVGFGVLFAGVVSSVLAGASTSLLLAFILPVTLPGSTSAIPDRVEGWLLAGAVSLIAITVLWPAPPRELLRQPAVVACRMVALRLQAEMAWAMRDAGATEEATDAAITAARTAVTTLRTAFFATPYRPTGLTTAARTLVRLVDEIVWLNAVLDQRPPGVHLSGDPTIWAVKAAAADLLLRGADRLEGTAGSGPDLRSELTRLREALGAMEGAATGALPLRRVAPAGGDGPAVIELVSSLEPSFRAQELSFAVSAIAENIDLTVAARTRSWWQQLLGRQPAGAGGPLGSAQERAVAHVEPHSVWLHNSLRGAIGLGIAVFIAEKTGVQHSFWVVLGTLSVLRSSALNTGQNAIRGLLGTAAGFVVGGLLVVAIGTNTTLLWFLLPVAILFAGLAPAVASFAAGQAGFTVTLLILFNIIAPTGWRVGLVRVEDVAIGCVVSLVVGVLFWPRGAAVAFGLAAAEAYRESAGYLRSAVGFGVGRCDGVVMPVAAPDDERAQAAAAARRLDDAFRGFLAERGTKHLPLADVTALITGVAGLRLTADAVLELWRRDDGTPAGDRTAARGELAAAADAVAGWYESMAAVLSDGRAGAGPLGQDPAADARLIDAVRRDLQGEDGHGTATAVRMIWTGDHVDAARRLQAAVAAPAQAAGALRQRRWFAPTPLPPWLTRRPGPAVAAAD
jgi:hypothetical protein